MQASFRLVAVTGSAKRLALFFLSSEKSFLNVVFGLPIALFEIILHLATVRGFCDN